MIDWSDKKNNEKYDSFIIVDCIRMQRPINLKRITTTNNLLKRFSSLVMVGGVLYTNLSPNL